MKLTICLTFATAAMAAAFAPMNRHHHRAAAPRDVSLDMASKGDKGSKRKAALKVRA